MIVPSLVSADEGFLGLFLGQNTAEGVVVNGVAAGTSAQKVGVKAGDIVVRYQGAPIHSASELIGAVKKTSLGTKAELVVKRDDKEIAFQIVIVSRKEALGEQVESLKGKKAPEVSGTDVINGKRIALSQFVGKPVIIALWATWCPACVKGIPKLNSLNSTPAGIGNGVVIIAVSFEPAAKVKAFAVQKSIKYNVIAADPSNMGMAYMNNASIPKYILVNDKGIVVDVFSRVEDVQQAFDKL